MRAFSVVVIRRACYTPGMKLNIQPATSVARACCILRPGFLSPFLVSVFLLITPAACGEGGNQGTPSPIPTAPWTRLLGSTTAEDARAIAVDTEGNVFIAGSTLGALPGLPAPAAEAAVLAKYDAHGTLLWTRLYEADRDKAMALALDAAGNIYLGGGSYGNLFGQENKGSQDAWIVKLDPAGEPLWARLFGTTANDGNHTEIVQDLVLDGAGNCYAVGITSGGLGDTYIGYQGMFVLKLDGAGNTLWRTNFGVAGAGVFNFGYGIALSGEMLYVTGSIGADFDGHVHLGGGDLVLLKLAAADGTKQWSRMIGSDRFDVGTSVKVDAAGNVYVTGHSQGDFDGHANPSLGGVEARIILVKYDAAGNKLWSRMAPGQSVYHADSALGVAIAPDGTPYVAGQYAIALGMNIRDLVVLRYSASGDLLATRIEDSGENELAYAITLDANGTVYVAGAVGDSLYGQPHAGPKGSFDILVMKMRGDLKK